MIPIIVLILILLPTAVLALQLLEGPPFSLAPKLLPIQFGIAVILFLRLAAGKALVPLSFIKQPVVIALGLYFSLAWYSLSFNKMSDHPYWVTHFALWSSFWFGIVPVYVFACAPRKAGDVLPALYAFVVASLIAALPAIQHAVTVRFAQPYMYMHNWGTKNAYADIFANAVLVAFGLMLTRRNIRWRIASATGVLIGLLGVLSTHSRGALLSTMAAILLVMLLVRVRLRYCALATALFIVGGATLYFVLPKETVEYNLDTGSGTSVSGRAEVLTDVWPLIQGMKLKPVGFGNDLIMPDKKVIIADYIPNIFLLDLVQLGPLGLLLSLLWFGLGLGLCVVNGKHVQPHSKLAAINTCATGVLIVAFYHANVDCFWSQISDKSVTFAFLGMVIFVRIALDAERAQRLANADKLLAD